MTEIKPETTMYVRWEFSHVAMRDDAPMTDAFRRMMRDTATRDAAGEGIDLTGIEPTVREDELVYVEDWSERGGEYIERALAESLGYDLPVRMIRVTMTWPLPPRQ